MTNSLYEADDVLRFPSPCGEKVGINKELNDVSQTAPYLEFPSPCGEKVGINNLLWGSR